MRIDGEKGTPGGGREWAGHARGYLDIRGTMAGPVSVLLGTFIGYGPRVSRPSFVVAHTEAWRRRRLLLSFSAIIASVVSMSEAPTPVLQGEAGHFVGSMIRPSSCRRTARVGIEA